MTKSGKEPESRVGLSSDPKKYYKEAAFDALLYWTNSTTEICGANTTLTLLTEMLSTGIVHLVDKAQADKAESVIFASLENAFDLLRENNSKVSNPNSDMN